MGRRLIVQRKTIKLILVLIVLLSILAFGLKTDLAETKAALSRIGPRFFIFILVTLLAYLTATWSWQLCLGDARGQIGFLSLFVLRQIGETVGQFNPTGVLGGDLLKIEMLTQVGLRRSASTQSVALSRVTLITSQLILLGISAIWIMTSFFKQNSSNYTFTVIASIILLLLLVLFFFWLLTTPRVSPAYRRDPKNRGQKITYYIQRILYDIQQGYQRNPLAFWISTGLAGLHWVLGSLEFYFILSFLGWPISVLQGLVMDMGVLVFKSAGAFIPGQLGVEELGNKIMLSWIGVGSLSIWLSVSVIRRSRQLIWLVIGLVLFLFYKKITLKNRSEHGSIVR
ncbi:MAG: lysylphosphatidylglycerol synthase transmembrane domain-containing protein [Sphingobacterium sp.]